MVTRRCVGSMLNALEALVAADSMTWSRLKREPVIWSIFVPVEAE